MKLILNNFRCYKNTVLELPETGIILLYGTSGIGKTTILKAIHFAITGKENKCVMYGEKKCSVRLEYNNMIITRTKNPTHLILEYENNKYEDEVAQNIIYKKYGEYFNVTSYIAQKSIDSFLNMSLQNKLEFFNSVALRNVNVSELKDKVKTKIKERKSLVNDKSNEIRILKNQLSTYQEPVKIDCPFGDISRKEYEQILITKSEFLLTIKLKLKEFTKNKDELKIELDKLDKDKKIHEEKMLEQEKNKKVMEQIEKDTQDTCKRLEEIKDKEPIYNFITYLYTYLRKILNNNEKIEQQKKNKEEQIREIEKKIKELKEKNITTHSDEEDAIYTKIFSLHKQFENYKNTIKDSLLYFTEENIKKFIFSSTQKVKDLKQKIEDNTSRKIELNQKLNYNAKKRLFCPSCKTSLSIIKSDICVYNHDEETKQENEKNEAIKQIENINIENVKIQKEIETENLGKQYEQMLSYFKELKIYLSINDFKTFYENFKNEMNTQKSISTNILEYEKNLQKLIIDLSQLREEPLNINFEIDFKDFAKICSSEFEMDDFKDWNDILELDKDTILDILEYANKYVDKENVKLSMLNKQKNELQLKLKNIQNVVNTYFDYDNFEKIKNEFNNTCGEIDILKLKEQEENETEKQIILYNNYLKEVDRYTSLKKKVDFCVKEEEVFIRSLNTAEKFLKILTDSETIAISNTVDNINFHIKQYTDLFFTDFQMQLTPYKETAKGDKKTGIDIEIYQNGEKVSLDALSGGEFDRCLLVIFLAFNNLTNSNILLLDECLSSLNSELVEDIVDVIKSNLSNKLVLVTLHQANTGIFDHVVDVEKLRT
jgi:exonuclease SbcC